MAQEFIDRLTLQQLSALPDFETVIDQLAEASDEVGARHVCLAVSHMILQSSKFKRKMIINKLMDQSFLCRYLLSQVFRRIRGTILPQFQLLNKNLNIKVENGLAETPPFVQVIGVNDFHNLGVMVGSQKGLNFPEPLDLPTISKVVMTDTHTLFLTTEGQVFASGLAANISLHSKLRCSNAVYKTPTLMNFPSTSTDEGEFFIDIAASEDSSILFSKTTIYVVGKFHLLPYLHFEKLSENCQYALYSLPDVTAYKTRVYNVNREKYEERTLGEIQDSDIPFQFEQDVEHVSLDVQFFRLYASTCGYLWQTVGKDCYQCTIEMYGFVVEATVKLNDRVLRYSHWTMNGSRNVVVMLNGSHTNRRIQQIVVEPDGTLTVLFDESFVARGRLEFFKKKVPQVDEVRILERHANLEIARKLKKTDMVAVLEEVYGTFGVTTVYSSPNARNIVLVGGNDMDIDSATKFTPQRISEMICARVKEGLFSDAAVPKNLTVIMDEGTKRVAINRDIFELSYPYAAKYIQGDKLNFSSIEFIDRQMLEHYITGETMSMEDCETSIIDGLDAIPFIHSDGWVRHRLLSSYVRTSFLPENCRPNYIVIIETDDGGRVEVNSCFWLLHAAAFLRNYKHVRMDPETKRPIYAVPFSSRVVVMSINMMLDLDLLIWRKMEELIEIYYFLKFHYAREALDRVKQAIVDAVCNKNIAQFYDLLDTEKEHFLEFLVSRGNLIFLSNVDVFPPMHVAKTLCELFPNPEVDEEKARRNTMCENIFYYFDIEHLARNFLTYETDSSDVLDEFAKLTLFPRHNLRAKLQEYENPRNIGIRQSPRKLKFKIENLLLLVKGLDRDVATLCDTVYGDSWAFRDFVKKYIKYILPNTEFHRIAQLFEAYKNEKSRCHIARKIILAERRFYPKLPPPQLIIGDNRTDWKQHAGKKYYMKIVMNKKSKIETSANLTVTLPRKESMPFSIQCFDKEGVSSFPEVINAFQNVGFNHKTVWSLNELRYFISQFEHVEIDCMNLAPCLRLDLVRECRKVIVHDREDATKLFTLWRLPYEILE